MTYSIVAVDEKTHDIGLAVQSHWFAAAHYVPFLRAGVGAIARQSLSPLSHGERGLDYLAQGKSPQQVLELVLAEDEGKEFAQTAIIGAQGDAVAYTGSRCIAQAGHRTGPFYSVQANVMQKATVWPAMEQAYLASSGPLPERLLAALEGAEREGGDLRGMQSASLIVVRGTATGSPTHDRVVELHVYDHEQPLHELRRLLRVQRAYEHVNAAELALVAGEIDVAVGEYGAGLALLPGNVEFQFWQGVALANAGQLIEAANHFGVAWEAGANWRELAVRLHDVALLTADLQPLFDLVNQRQSPRQT
jgi:uncharacterized Ntn-hydrolase superfamily protein